MQSFLPTWTETLTNERLLSVHSRRMMRTGFAEKHRTASFWPRYFIVLCPQHHQTRMRHHPSWFSLAPSPRKKQNKTKTMAKTTFSNLGLTGCLLLLCTYSSPLVFLFLFSFFCPHLFYISMPSHKLGLENWITTVTAFLKFSIHMAVLEGRRTEALSPQVGWRPDNMAQ